MSKKITKAFVRERDGIAYLMVEYDDGSTAELFGVNPTHQFYLEEFVGLNAAEAFDHYVRKYCR